MHVFFPQAVRNGILLTLVLLAHVCPAEGLFYYPQREPLSPPTPQLESNPYQIIVNLSGIWDCRGEPKDPPQPQWIPGSFEDPTSRIELTRTFTLSDTLRRFHYQLHLPEIHYAVEVWLNGHLVSSLAGSHLGFSCDIARDHLRFNRPNELVLRVSRELDPRKTLPVRPQILQPRDFGGILAGVYLRGVPPLSLEMLGLDCRSYSDSTAADISARIRVGQYGRVTTAPDSAQGLPQVRCLATLRDSTGKELAAGWSDRVEAGRGEGFQLQIPLRGTRLALWSPAKPTLYMLTAVLIAGTDTLHSLSRTVGVKQVAVTDGDLFLNGHRLIVRGIDYVPEHMVGRRVLSQELLHTDLERIRSLGMNAIRVPFGPPPPMLLNAADRFGLLVFVESSLQAVPDAVLAVPEYRELALRAIEQMVIAYRDNVSVLAWGIASHLDWQKPDTKRITAEFRHRIAELDNRPTYIESPHSAAAGGVADFQLASIIPYTPDLPRQSDLAGEMPIVISRLGQLAVLNDPKPGQTAGIILQAETLLRQLHSVEANNDLDGFLIHAYADYHGSSPLLVQPMQHDPLLYTFGIVTFDRQERLAYSKLRELVQTGEAAVPASHEQEGGGPAVFPLVGLAALLLLSIEMRRNNVFRQNMKRVFLHPHGFYSDLRYRRFLHTGQPLLLLLLEAVTLAVLLASAFYLLRSSFALDYYLSHFVQAARAKAWLINLIWDPVRAVIYFTVFFAAGIMLKALGVRLLSLLFREHADIWQSLNYIIWAFAAVVLLLPVAIVYFRTGASPRFSTIANVLIAIGILWSALRLIGALRTGFGTTHWRIVLMILIVGSVTGALALALLNTGYATLIYLPFFQSVYGVWS